MQEPVVNEVVELNKVAMHAALNALEAAVDGADRIGRHQIASVWGMIRDTIDSSGALARANDTGALDDWRQSALQPIVVRFLDDSRRHFELSVQAQRRVTDVAEEQFASFTLRSAETLARLSQRPDDQFRPLLDTLRKSVRTSINALDEMRRTANGLVTLAEIGTRLDHAYSGESGDRTQDGDRLSA